MKEPKLSKESKRAFVRRFAANVKERMESQEVKAGDLGRAAYPESPSPNSAVYNMLHAANLPSDEVMQRVARVLNCTVEALHHGELEQYKGGEPAKAHRQGRTRTGTPHPNPLPRAEREPEQVDRGLAPAEADELYGFVLDAVCACAAHLAEPRKGQYIREIARTCRKYQAGQ